MSITALLPIIITIADVVMGCLKAKGGTAGEPTAAKGRDNMETVGFAFHCHHSILAEWCTDFEGRVRVINSDKPASERPLRLRLFKMIPLDRVPATLLQADEARDKTWEAYEAYKKAREAYDEARKVYDKALAAATPELEALHKELCPDCPWDGRTIFTTKGLKAGLWARPDSR